MVVPFFSVKVTALSSCVTLLKNESPSAPASFDGSVVRAGYPNAVHRPVTGGVNDNHGRNAISARNRQFIVTRTGQPRG